MYTTEDEAEFTLALQLSVLISARTAKGKYIKCCLCHFLQILILKQAEICVLSACVDYRVLTSKSGCNPGTGGSGQGGHAD